MNKIPSDNVCLVPEARTTPPRLSIEGVSTFYGEAQALRKYRLPSTRRRSWQSWGATAQGNRPSSRHLPAYWRPARVAYPSKVSRIEGRPPHEIIRKGIASVPEGRELFGTMTVMENLLLGTYSLTGKRRKETLSDRLAMVYHLFPILKERLDQRADTMSGGQQQMLAVARSLMAMPTLLALDEPSLGLSPLLVAEMMRVLKEICRNLEVSLLLVEQNAQSCTEDRRLRLCAGERGSSA